MSALNSKIPFPVFSKLLDPLSVIPPLKVNWVPSTSTVELANNVIEPAKVLVPVEVEIVPLFLSDSVVE